MLVRIVDNVTLKKFFWLVLVKDNAADEQEKFKILCYEMNRIIVVAF